MLKEMTQRSNAMQRMFRPASTVLDLAQENVRRFWESQDKILDSIESFADGWLKRRHAGTHAAREAAQRMCKAQTPFDLIREYQDWANGAFQRIMEDRSACQEQFKAIASALGGPPALLGGKQETEPSQSDAKSVNHSKAA